ncbi:uncharacterized protein NEMAJ01_1035 [Nematocida major]|uniref:uncharacterized protein n=1 Tax=Nematocida major TaxID=1912982 RepID=UPI002007CD4A|nr:uncharacterized protein NEMAJ01_1035 [Nematocida major]KAH9386139.1 hypothetical protein NEMAJ01_1035 [Nematocida major]
MQSVLAFVLLERLCFYTIKSNMFLYSSSYLKYTSTDSTICMHVFMFLSYFCCVFSGHISVYAGECASIFLSLVLYVMGVLCMCASALIGKSAFFLGGVLMVSLGAGGIKPNVSSFGARVSEPENAPKMSISGNDAKNEKNISQRGKPTEPDKNGHSPENIPFFSWYCLTVNAGSFLAMFITPGSAWSLLASGTGIDRHVLRAENISEHFFVFTLALFLVCMSAVVFLLVSLQYALRRLWNAHLKRKKTPTISISGNDFIPENPENSSGLPTSENKPESPTAFSLSPNIPMVVAWSVYDQMSSTWTEQGKRMNCTIQMCGISAQIVPSQMPIFNAIVLILAIPGHNSRINRITRALKIPNTHKHRVAYGIACIAVSHTIFCALNELVKKQKVSILFQVPQILVLTAGELLVSVSGMSLSYRSTPRKSVAMGNWFLNVASGNLLVVLVSALCRHFRLPESVRSITYLVLIYGVLIYSLRHKALSSSK